MPLLGAVQTTGFDYVYIFSLYGRKTDRKKGVSRTVWDCGKLAEFSTFPYLLWGGKGKGVFLFILGFPFSQFILILRKGWFEIAMPL